MKNRYYGKVKVTDPTTKEVIDFAVVKTKKAKGKNFFVAAVLDAITAIGKSAFNDDEKQFDFDYQGDFGELVHDLVIRAGCKDLGTTKGDLGGFLK